MRSKSTILISIVLISSTLLWAGNLQKFQPLDGPLYRKRATLYIQQTQAQTDTVTSDVGVEASRVIGSI